MLAVILGILKVIFTALLVLLGILLICLLFVLFCPIFYRADGHKNTEDLALHLKGSWFLGLLKVHFDYPKPGHFIIKLLWFTLYDSSRPPKEKTKADKKKHKSDKSQYHPAINTSLLSSIEEEEEAKASAKSTVQNQTAPSAKPSDSDTTQTEQDSSSDASGSIEKILCSFRKIYDKIKHIRSEMQFYKKLYETPEMQKLIVRVPNRAKRIIVTIIPKKFDANLLLGTGQPDSTGYATAVYGMLSPFLGSKVNFTPDFENKIFEGNFKARGHITVFTIVKNLLFVLLDPNFRLVLRRIKKHRAKLNKTVSAG